MLDLYHEKGTILCEAVEAFSPQKQCTHQNYKKLHEDAFGTAGGRISVTQSLENESEKSVTHSVLGTVLLSRPTGGSSSSSNGTPSGGGMSTADLAYFGLQRNPENAIDAPKGAVPTSSKVFPRFKCLNNKLIGRPRRVLVEKTDESSVSDDSGEMEKQQNSAGVAGCPRSEQENLLPSTSQGPSNTDSLKENQVACFPGPPKTTMVSGSIMKLKEGLPSLKIQGTQCSFALGYSVPHPCSQLPRAMQKLCEISESLESQSEKVNIPPCSQLPRAMQKLCEISESLESQSEKVNIPPINELAKSLSGMAKTNNSYQKVKSTAKSAYGELSLTKEVEGRVVSYVAKSLVEEKSVDTEKSQPRSALEPSLSNSFPMAVKDQSCSSSQQAEHSIGSAVPSSAAIVYPAQMTAITSSSSTTGGSIISSEKQVALHDGQARVNISEGSRSSYSTVQHQAPKLNKDEVTIPLEQPKKVPSLLALSSTGDKAASRGREGGSRKAGESDHFVWVNNRRYQKLGKIGCGGSSDVYKVISQDCTIFALKRIKLKGRDHQTASGFYQEIEYLQRLHGQRHIIKLVDFEVSDKKIFEDINAQHGEFIVEDAFIYMVLEYGEIDLACMLDQKKKEMSERKKRLDENWLRLYLEHILEAVNTIHEVRIVHADLKPANFLLVNGVLKLIDFGIAKAIQNDTTNIVRESQVGTLNYMSPEAFMMNTCDERGSVVKCGRASDIWSLGCILYQMVYGRTPFSHLNLYAKIKEITNPKHEIEYPSVSNSAVVDFMQKCLVWDKNKRLRIPQLLEHPFLRPLSICYSLPYTTSHGPESLQELVQSCCDYVSVAGASQFRILMQKVIMGDFESVHEEDYLRSVLVQSLKHWISENGPLGLQEIVKTVASSVEKKYNSAS